MPENTQDKKRPGRPPTGKARNVCVTISLPPDLHNELKKLGGSPWVQEKIREAIYKKSNLVNTQTP